MNCVITPTTDLNECDDGEIKNKDVVIALVDGFRLLSTSPLYSEILVDPVHRRLKHLHEQPVRVGCTVYCQTFRFVAFAPPSPIYRPEPITSTGTCTTDIQYCSSSISSLKCLGPRFSFEELRVSMIKLVPEYLDHLAGQLVVPLISTNKETRLLVNAEARARGRLRQVKKRRYNREHISCGKL